MIENYRTDEFGVIHQVKCKPYSYNKDYITRNLEPLGEKLTQMSHLRLGYVIGSIGKIPESILDIGYGDGSFLKVCRNIIKHCYGNDISGYPVPDGCSFFPEIKPLFFDVVTFFDSLEHISDIYLTMAKISCKYICISVPWCHYYSDAWFKTWRHLKPDEHLHHFNKVALEHFFNSFGYSLVTLSNIEDTIRKGDKNNILTATFKKEG